MIDLGDVVARLATVRAMIDSDDFAEDDLPMLADLLDQLRTLATATTETTWAAAARVGDLLGDRFRPGKASLPDGRTVEYATGDRRVWDRDREGACLEALRKVAAADRHLDPATGEIEAPDDALCRILRSAARLEWRATALRDVGLDPDAYSDWKRGRPSVRITGGAP